MSLSRVKEGGRLVCELQYASAKYKFIRRLERPHTLRLPPFLHSELDTSACNHEAGTFHLYIWRACALVQSTASQKPRFRARTLLCHPDRSRLCKRLPGRIS